jgi:hypothetical protein
VLLLPGVRGAPLVLFTPGFLLNSALYRATASRLASWGWAVGLWDLNEVLDDTLTTVYMSEVGNTPQLHARHTCCCVCGHASLLHVPSPVPGDDLVSAPLPLHPLHPQAIELVGRRCAGVVDTGRLVLAGHSRGAKLSARLAAQVCVCVWGGGGLMEVGKG